MGGSGRSQTCISKQPRNLGGVTMHDKTSLNDPRKRYPASPFPDQPQPGPGLAQNMDPVPDHGEQSYRGSGRLTGRNALITEGDSLIGRAAAIAFTLEGSDVAIAHPVE